ncbi:ABC transporter ATP-binding protein [Geovibrio thiophilus]|uniref:ABC transporter ATP-binding protein n=1 Tax=Geovibrio thiophilus TaxID=139438 RepID=A0A410K0U4_9BACT|nr:ATP-binding cassette domain-containing protein [Geovibrio thiophilus]QAR33993.1 ABC transporter ATP-binding protein [Geovibrio thiophilus]
MEELLAEVKNLTKRFAADTAPALDNISLKIFRGRMTGLVGPDGAGKTTLMRHMIGLLHGDSGTVTVKGMNAVTDAPEIREITGYMPQKFGLYEDLTVQENLNLYADLCGLEKGKRGESFRRLLEFTALREFTNRLAGRLSGGMKQKLGLACALLGEPELLLLDEPSVGVDPISRRELWKMVKALLDRGMGVVWSTAYLDEAEKCDDVILLNEGRMLFEGRPSALLADMKGRVFIFRGACAAEKRSVLTELLNKAEVADGIIQGSGIRIVLKKDAPMPQVPDSIHAEPAAPSFEDGFIDRLGGGPGGHSPLADMMNEKPENSGAVIEALGLTKRFGDFTAVRDNSFAIRRGEIFGLLGPNGAGKSTTFKMMCGLLQPTSGSAHVTGLDLKTATSAARSRIGYMAQKFSLYGNLSVRQNLSFFSGVYGLAGREAERAADEMTEIFDLGRYRSVNADTLPLGFKQRLALACAVMHSPDVLFLDEPTSGVDPVTRREFWNHINGMVKKGVTVMVTTHFMDEAEYCDRIGLIYRGENIASGTPDQLKESVRSGVLPSPSLEDAFIELIKRFDEGRKL